jgi:hypothetical protein
MRITLTNPLLPNNATKPTNTIIQVILVLHAAIHNSHLSPSDDLNEFKYPKNTHIPNNVDKSCILHHPHSLTGARPQGLLL